MPKASKAKVAANARWDAKAYDKFLVRVPKGRKETIQTAAEDAGQSLNGYVAQAIDERMEREGIAATSKEGEFSNGEN